MLQYREEVSLHSSTVRAKKKTQIINLQYCTVTALSVSI